MTGRLRAARCRSQAGQSPSGGSAWFSKMPAGCRHGDTLISMATREQINEALRAVIDPELRQDIVELGMVRSIELGEDGAVAVMVSLTTPGCPIRNHFQTAVVEAVRVLEGVTKVDVAFDVLSDTEKGELQRKLGRGGLPAGALAQVANVVCVGSGKGGVGKSTLTANL